MKHQHVPFGLTGLILIAAACSSAAPPSASDEGALTFESISPLLDLATGGDAPARSYVSLRERAVEDCMTAKGWQYEAIVLGVEGPHESTRPAAMRNFRERFGYGLLNNTGVAHAARAALNRRHDYFDSLSREAQQRFMTDLGASSDDDVAAEPSGCRGDAEERMNRRFPATTPAIAAEIADAHRAVVATPAYQQAEREWVDCMDQRGFHYRDVHGAHNEISAVFMSGVRDEAAQARERAVASADAQCSLATVWPVQARLERALAQELSAKHELGAPRE
jgi:hypothetical protein